MTETYLDIVFLENPVNLAISDTVIPPGWFLMHFKTSFS